VCRSDKLGNRKFLAAVANERLSNERSYSGSSFAQVRSAARGKKEPDNASISNIDGLDRGGRFVVAGQ